MTTVIERGPYISESGQIQLSEISDAELLLWSTRRLRGAVKAEIAASYQERDRFILRVAQLATHEYPQTIRHIYYKCSGLQLVGKDHGKETYWYNIVADIICEARWAGTANSNAQESKILPWKNIVDETRSLYRPLYYDSYKDFRESTSPLFGIEMWKNQPYRVIVCTEKDTIESMLYDVCHQFQVPLISFHGQASDGGVIYPLAKYIADYWALTSCDTVKCLYLGDYDPSGLSIDRAVFGDEFAKEERDESVYARKRFGKLPYLLTHEFNFSPEDLKIDYERIAIVPTDVENPDYESIHTGSERIR